MAHDKVKFSSLVVIAVRADQRTSPPAHNAAQSKYAHGGPESKKPHMRDTPYLVLISYGQSSVKYLLDILGIPREHEVRYLRYMDASHDNFSLIYSSNCNLML